MPEILCFLIVPVVTQLYVMVYSDCIFKFYIQTLWDRRVPPGEQGMSRSYSHARSWSQVTGPWSLPQGGTVPVCLATHPPGLRPPDTNPTGHKSAFQPRNKFFRT